MKVSFQFRATMLSILILVVLLGIWQVSTAPAESAQPITTMTAAEAEYAALMGLPVPGQDSVVQKNDGFPTPAQFGAVALQHLSAPFYDNGPNDKGIGIQLLHSLARVAIGYLLAMAVAIPLGFVIGMSPLLYKALDRSAIPMPIYSFLTKSAACFLLHRGRFHRRLATTASAFLSTG